MKTTSYIRLFIVIATMITMACSEPEVAPKPNPKPGPKPNNTSTQEFYTSVTTWQWVKDGVYTGIISQTPVSDLYKVSLYWNRNGERVYIDNVMDRDRLEMFQDLYGGYMWATVRNNIFVVNYMGKNASSRPPFPLDVVIVY